MRTRLIALLAVAALLLLGAAPVSAAPGGVPGPPEDHGKTVDDGDVEAKELPEQAKAYGKRIKDAYDGTPYGHLQQCVRYLDAGAEVEADLDEGEDPQGPEWLEDCESLPPLPELDDDRHGAKAFFVVFTEMGEPVVGV